MTTSKIFFNDLLSLIDNYLIYLMTAECVWMLVCSEAIPQMNM